MPYRRQGARRRAIAEIKDAGRANKRNLGNAGVKPDAAFGQIAHHATRRVKAKRRDAGKQHRVDPFGRVPWAQQVRFAGGRPAAAHIDSWGRAVRAAAKQYGAACFTGLIFGAADAHAVYIGNRDLPQDYRPAFKKI